MMNKFVPTARRVILSGPVFSQSGYGVHTRQIASWLLKKHEAGEISLMLNPLGWGSSSWINEGEEIQKLYSLVVDTRQIANLPDVSFQVGLPHEWNYQGKLAKKNIGVTALVETDICSKEWVNCAEKIDYVVVPSEFSKSTLMRSGSDGKNVHVIGESFKQGDKKTENLNLQFKDNTFLIVGQISGDCPNSDRKNILYAVKWFCEEFKGDQNVELVVKTNFGSNNVFDKNYTVNVFKETLAQVREGEFPKVTLLHGDMTDSEVQSLYKNKKMKGLISLTKGEGFGLPILEAASAGLPVIATNWSAHTEYLNLFPAGWIPVDYQMIPMMQKKIDNRIFVAGSHWAMPYEDDFKKKIRLLKSTNSSFKTKAQMLADRIEKKYSVSAIEKEWDKLWSLI